MLHPRFHIVLFQPEIPQNTGNVGRTCVAAGAKLWLVRPLGFRMDARHLRRAGLDYWQYLDWQIADTWQELCSLLPAERMWLFTKHARQAYTEVSYATGDVLVFGSESQGLPAPLRDAHAQRSVRIPMQPEVRSLNLSSSVAVGLYEALRQTHGGDDWFRGSS